ncbi:putative transferase, protein kinase RLK-Pelle-RLCK-VIIa-2 family [Helianthus annuus]|nr:putative transferase, protein kinase RLK-Pelle-RLCK-VIIa-2 family [Helianthus annuus]
MGACFSVRLNTENSHPDSELIITSEKVDFKGWIDEQSRVATKPGVGTAVAVKRFNKHYHSQSDQDWLADMNYFGQLNHENLVKYIGYCLEGGHRLLVYEFMPRGSLANHLFISEFLQLYLVKLVYLNFRFWIMYTYIDAR